MLELTLKVVPHGNERAAEELLNVRIVNDGRHPARPEFGNYDVFSGERKIGRVVSYRRVQPVTQLLQKALDLVEKDRDRQFYEAVMAAMEGCRGKAKA